MIKTTFITILRLVLAVLLFGNAVGTGVCGLLCSAQVCCNRVAPTTVRAESKAPSCCKRQANPKGSAHFAAVERKNCCAWIAKKIDPPATALKAIVAAGQSAPAILRQPPAVVAVELRFVKTPVETTDDRAPPERLIERPASRAPPIGSV